jgi:predicted nucleic acid-binding Zn ribbon protein
MFEIFHSISETRRKCPSCGKQKLRKLIGAGAGLIFKGSGFYITDYRSEDYKKKAKAESGDSSAGAGDAKSSKSSSEPSGAASGSSVKDAGGKADGGAKVEGGAKKPPKRTKGSPGPSASS